MLKHCLVCGKDVVSKYPCRQICCSDECRKIGRKKALEKFDKSIKGIECEKRWRLSERKKITDKKYRQSEKGREYAKMRVAKFKSNHYRKVVDGNNRLMRIYWRMRRSVGERFREWREWWKEHSEKGCAMCGRKDKLCIDHIIPRIKGGTDELNNLQVLCIYCNGKKGYGKIEKTSPIWKSNVKNVISN